MRALALTVFAVLALAVPARAATIPVDTTASGGGNCAVAGACTLQQAFADANGAAGPDTIILPPGVYDQTGEDLIVSIGEQVTLVGSDPRTTIVREVSGGDGRVFLVEQDAVLDVSGITATGSRDASAVLLFGSNVTFRATNTVFTGNTAAKGAAIDGTGGSVTLAHTTLTQNTATGKGGGVHLGHPDARLTTVNSTIALNSAPDGAGVAVDQGAANLRATTVAGNSGAPDVRGNVAAHASLVGTCANAIGTHGFNATGDPACALAGAGDRTAPLQLAAFGDHGGVGPTFLPAAGSPAIDADPTCAAGPIDQRGAARPRGAACDAGAVEFPSPAAAAPAPVATPPVTAPRIELTTLRVRPSRWRIASRRARITFRLSRAAKVRFTVQRAKAGRRVGTRCAAPTRRNRGKERCTRFVTLRGHFTRQGRAGDNAVRYGGRLRGRRLRTGRYRLLARVVPSGARARTGLRVVTRRR